MNEQLREYARTVVTDGLSELMDANRTLFKRMYAHGNMDLAIDAVVASMSDDELNTAMDQVQRTIAKHKAKPVEVQH